MNREWHARYEVAVAAAQQAGAIAHRHYPEATASQFSRRIEWKADQSPVTVADREAEAHLREVVLARFPDDGFLGEEFGEKLGSSGYRWVVDPIDGTRSFVRGIPLWGTLVGVEHHGIPVIGVVVEPALNTTYRALRGDGCFRNDQKIGVSPVAQLSEALLASSDLTYFYKAGQLQKLLDLAILAQRHRSYGDYFGFMLVAQGSADAMIDHGVHIWDVCAVVPVIEEAGGRFTNWNGQLDLTKPDVVASNGLLHDTVLRRLQS